MTTLENIGRAKVNAVIGLSYVLAFFQKLVQNSLATFGKYLR